MNDIEKMYFDKWMEQVQENKKLKLEIEKLNKIRDYNSNFKDKMEFLERECKRYNKALNSLKLRLHSSIKENERLKNHIKRLK
jgi:regulator of replication initiation timing